MSNKYRMVKWKENSGGIPTTYTELTYIQSSGSQYINTGLIINFTNLKIEYKYRKTSSLSTNPLGFDANGGVRLMHGNIYGSSGYYGNSSVVGIPQVLDTDYEVTFEISNALGYGKWTINGTEYRGRSLNGWTDANTSTQTHTDFLFATNANNDTPGYSMAGRLYYVKYYKDDELIANFVPAQRDSDSVLGMYDTIRNTFFTNAGSGSFTAGESLNTEKEALAMVKENKLPSTYTELEYLQSSGTQAISLGSDFDPSTLKLELDGSFDTLSVGRIGNVSGIRCYFGVVSNKWAIGYNSVYDHSIADADTNRHIFINASTAFLIDGTILKTFSRSTNSIEIDLFGAFDSGSTQYKASMKIYNCKIYRDGFNISMNLIPSKRNSDNVLGLYDTVNDVFYTNSGSGTFTAGPEINTKRYMITMTEEE